MRFTIDVGNSQASEQEVAKVQRYLYRFGYLKAGFDSGRLDSPTQEALMAYQQRAGITASGLIDEPTARLLEEPRCGVPDWATTRTSADGEKPFTLFGCKYDGAELTYSIVRPAAFFTLVDVGSAIRRAFETWQREIPVDFREVSQSEPPTLTFTWVAGQHGDGEPFDGQDGNILAHAFSPPMCGGTHAGQCHFDDEERWGLSHSNGIRDIQTVALHEIGHLLGLGHRTDGVMFEKYRGEARTLSKGDIKAIQSLYGSRS